jgi:hypothetical protein
MIERGGGARLAEHALEPVGFAGRVDELQRDLAVEHQVVGKADLAHASAADDLADAIPRPAGRLRRHVPAGAPDEGCSSETGYRLQGTARGRTWTQGAW